MEYLYSRLVDPSEYLDGDLEGLFDGISVRQHKQTNHEIVGTLRAQQDWAKHVNRLNGYHGGLGDSYNIMATCIPECLPDRLEIISYANEFAFLHDDIIDNVDRTQGDQQNDELLATFLKGAKDDSLEFSGQGIELIQMQMLREMATIDRERAITTVRAWSKFIENGSGRQHHVAFETLESYLPYRIRDVGEMFWYGMMTFGLAITIPEAEDATCKRLVRPAFAALCLTNDLFSWEKEHQSAIERGLGYVPNAIGVLMKEHSISIAEAKALCRRAIKESVSEYVNIAKQSTGNTSLSPDLRRYLDALRYTLSGNAVWTVYSPRYGPPVQSSDVQVNGAGEPARDFMG